MRTLLSDTQQERFGKSSILNKNGMASILYNKDTDSFNTSLSFATATSPKIQSIPKQRNVRLPKDEHTASAVLYTFNCSQTASNKQHPKINTHPTLYSYFTVYFCLPKALLNRGAADPKYLQDKKIWSQTSF